jgi:histidine triad (HIT) family protein
MSEDCIFCGIVAGEVPSYTLYEDDEVVSFLDVNPASDGHALVVPKGHDERLAEMDDAAVAATFTTARDVAAALEDALAPPGYNVVQNNGAAAGQEVDHAHVHVIPRTPGDDVAFGWQPGDLDEERAEELVERVGEHL